MFCDEKRQLRFNHYRKNGYVTFLLKTHVRRLRHKLKKDKANIDAKKNRTKKKKQGESKVFLKPGRDYVDMEDVGKILTIGSTPSPAGSRAGIARILRHHMYNVSNITCDFYRSRVYSLIDVMRTGGLVKLQKSRPTGIIAKWDEARPRVHIDENGTEDVCGFMTNMSAVDSSGVDVGIPFPRALPRSGKDSNDVLSSVQAGGLDFKERLYIRNKSFTFRNAQL